MQVFLSVGTKLRPDHEAFVVALEARLRGEGLEPRTVGRNVYSVDAPFRSINRLMDDCRGLVVVALERTRFPEGVERAGSAHETALGPTQCCTPWNQIEAALAHARGLPLLVIVERGLRQEGLLEPGADWYVLTVDPTPETLASPEFSGILASWRRKLVAAPPAPAAVAAVDPAQMTVGQLAGALKPSHLYGVLGALAAAFAASFAAGARLLP